MEVDPQKETNDDAASISDLPNEILLMLFRKLRFRELLQATAVCHRWNELAFFLLQDRVLLRVGRTAWVAPGASQERIPNRIYRAVATGCTSARFTLDSLKEDVRELELTSESETDECLLVFLSIFKEVETLTVRVDRLTLCKTPLWFQRGTNGLLPSVRHLTLRCRYVRIAGLLAEVAPRLVSLDLELLPRLLANFCECRFDCLEALTLRFKVANYAWSLPKEQNLISCLRRMRVLRKLGLIVENVASVFEVAFALTSLEELTLGGKFNYLEGHHFNGLSKLTNLRSLIIDVKKEGLFVWLNSNPCPSIKTLVLKGPISIQLAILIKKFPNLKALETLTRSQHDDELSGLVGSTWQNTMEDLTIQIESFKPEVIVCFGVLRKLRKLCLHYRGEPENLESFAIIVASVDTLKELHIRGLYGAKWYASAAELANIYRFSCGGCAIYINEQPIEFYAMRNQN